MVEGGIASTPRNCPPWAAKVIGGPGDVAWNTEGVSCHSSPKPLPHLFLTEKKTMVAKL